MRARNRNTRLRRSSSPPARSNRRACSYFPPDLLRLQGKTAAEVVEQTKRLRRSRVLLLHGESAPSGDKYVALSTERDRFGDSVTDRFGKVHATRSLFVVGGSNFASSSTLHPTLTMVALAIRAAGHMIDQVL